MRMRSQQDDEILSAGDQAPNFNLPCDSGSNITLMDFKNILLILYFYPKDDTPGCTREAIAFSNLHDDFANEGARIVGVSPDNISSHEKFKKKNSLKITLASDETLVTLQDYGVWIKKNMYGRQFMGVNRSSFLIDGNGRIIKIWRNIKISRHPEEVLQEIKEYKSSES